MVNTELKLCYMKNEQIIEGRCHGMKIVFVGSTSRVVSYGSCGCACHPSIGAIGSNKPSLQVSH